MVHVFFKSKNHTEKVAIFDDEELYNSCIEQLQASAHELRMELIESIDDKSIYKLK